MMENRKIRTQNFVFIAIALVVLAIAPFIGSQSISFADIAGIFGGGAISTGQRIFWDVRMPRVLLGFITGATLSVCGMTFQAMFRNPLATPFTLGVSGGAALGAVIAIKLGIATTVMGIALPGAQVFAFIGALGSIVIVYGIARAKKGFTMATMLLTGIAMSFFFSASIMFIQYLADFAHSFSIVRWMMGGIAVVGYRQVLQLAAFAIVGVAVIFSSRSELNLILTGDEIATGRGLDVERMRKKLFFAVSIAAGATVAVCGPIGFVGLIIPHIMRLIVGADHFDLAPACILGGGAFLVVCDIVARTIILPAEIPIGIITSMIGGPFFIWLLFRHPN